MNPWLIAELTSCLQATFPDARGERPAVDHIEDTALDCVFQWRQTFFTVPGALWIAALEPPDVEKIKHAMSGLARSFSTQLNREVRCDQGEERPAVPGKMNWMRFDVMLSDSAVSLLVSAEADLLKAIAEEKPAPENSRTFDLLMDVELPVSVSFGRAQVALRDVLKLTTGSIVELNRSIGDPVEVIVNNCVIARGEVVTVEGNFGVRIHQVISRQERLRTLK